jgi:uncharacterized membrane protein required for colicin V production
MNITLMDVVLIAFFVAVCCWAIAQRLLRQLMSLAVFYVATVVAGLFYYHAARIVTVIGGATPRLTEMVMFWILFLAVTTGLELLLRRYFPDVDLPQLGPLDRALALVPGILCGLILASLLITSLGYASSGTWGHGLAHLRAAVARGYDNALLRPPLGQFLSFYLVTHLLWFPTPPPLLAYTLP